MDVKAELRRPRRGKCRSQKGTDEAKHTNMQAATGTSQRPREAETHAERKAGRPFITTLTITQRPVGKDVQTHF